VSGLAGDNAAKQISMLLYCLGKQSKAVFDLTDITAEEKEVYKQLLPNLMYRGTSHLNKPGSIPDLHLQEGEGAEHYITALYELHSRTLQTHIGDDPRLARSRNMRRWTFKALALQLDPKLTLEMAKKAIRQHEPVHGQQRELKGVQLNSLEALASDACNRETLRTMASW